MKVGVFLGNNKPEAGGGYTFESEIYRSLVKSSFKTHHKFVVFGWSREPPQEISGKNIQYISLHCSLIERVISKFSRTAIQIFEKLLSPLGQFKIYNGLEKFIVMNRIELLWCLTPNCPTMEVPYITVVWDLQHRLQPYFPEVGARGQWDFREQLYGVMLRRALIVITGTSAGKAEIEHFYQVPTERIKVLPHPTPTFMLENPAVDRTQVLSKYNIPENYLFYPAQFWPHKNHAGLLKSVQLLRDKYNLVFPVVLVGSDKGNEKFLKQLAVELGISKQVHFLGFVPQEDLISLYRNAFALVYITFFGPENMPPLEAFALGCPVVASNISGAEEQLNDAALLVDPKDPNQIALAVKSLHDNITLRNTLIQKGLEKASRWNGEDFVKGVLSILDEYEPVLSCWSNKEYHHKTI